MLRPGQRCGAMPALARWRAKRQDHAARPPSVAVSSSATLAVFPGTIALP